MKINKITLAVVALAFGVNAMGANMCIKDDVVMVILDPVVNGSSLSSNATGKTWSASFNYGVISGIGGCGGEAVSVAGAVATNQNALSPTSTGKYCFCKMLRPAVSQWVFCRSATATCESDCASYCASFVGSTVAIRQGMFSSIGM